MFEDSLKDAERTIDRLMIDKDGFSADTHIILSKALHRKAQAQLSSGDVVNALKTYKFGLRTIPESESLIAATRLALDSVTPTWLATFWSRAIEAAEQPNPLSSRDGKLLKPVPSPNNLSPSELIEVLAEQFSNEDYWSLASKEGVVACWRQNWILCRSELAMMRGLAYLNAGNAVQAEKDAQVAYVYGPQDKSGKCLSSPVLLLHSNALERRGDNVMSLLYAARAVEVDEECFLAKDVISRLVNRVPDHYAQAVNMKGSIGIEQILKAEEERSLPPYMRPRPKYYYYYQWMQKRIEALHPDLEEEVMDKLMTLDANELNLLLQFPSAVESTIKDLQTVLINQGKEALERYAVPLLSYEQVQGLKLEAPPTEERPLLEAANKSENLLADGQKDEGIERSEDVDVTITTQQASKESSIQAHCKLDLD